MAKEGLLADIHLNEAAEPWILEPSILYDRFWRIELNLIPHRF